MISMRHDYRSLRALYISKRFLKQDITTILEQILNIRGYFKSRACSERHFQ